MRNILIPLLLLFGLFMPSILPAKTVIDDYLVKRSIEDFVTEKRGKDGKEFGLNGEALAKQLAEAPKSISLELGESESDWSYDRVTQSVGVLSSFFDCGKCDRWHMKTASTTWCLSSDGIFVTNYHCFSENGGESFAVGMLDGKVAMVTEILAADQLSDLCIFRVDGTGFKPLPLAKESQVGDEIRIVSHPRTKFYLQTSGEISRFYWARSPGLRKQKTLWQSVTADFAKGSSGGPLVNRAGEVVGIVSKTESLYTPKTDSDSDGKLQMVINKCSSLTALKKLIKP